jgi:hypothetical protein
MIGETVRVLETLPKYRYIYTCPDCGCHVIAAFRFFPSDGGRWVMCGCCQRVYKKGR